MQKCSDQFKEPIQFYALTLKLGPYYWWGPGAIPSSPPLSAVVFFEITLIDFYFELVVLS
jgi:hypothetical protein